MTEEVKHNQLIIKAPFLEKEQDKCYLKAELVENGESRMMFFGVDSRYGAALTHELADCFLVAVLPHAMIESLDIVCEVPVSRHLLYSLKNRLIPELAGHTKRYHSIQIIAQPSDLKFSGNTAAGTGWSGGTDCLYTLIEMLKVQEPRHRLTHFLNINAGVFEGSEANMQKEFQLNSDEAKKAAAEFGFDTLDLDTNIHLLFHENYLSVGPFRLCAGVLALQKFFSVYYISSAYEITTLSLNEANAFYYEYTICSCCRTQNLSFHEIGSEITRLEKLNRIAEEPIAQRHLHVCVKSSVGNCLRCGKCVRTIAALYALEKLDCFYQVFDKERLENEMDEILGDTFFHRRSQHYKEALELMEKKGIPLSVRAKRHAAFLEAAGKAARMCKEKILKEEKENA